MNDMCTDNRFEAIEKYKQKLIESTNIETAQDEMAVIDNILFRFWQMGWLPATQPEPHWIPCSERLPEDVKNGEEYPTLIYCTGGGEVDAGWYEAEVHKWWDLNCDVTVDNVIAWMPLPEPYNPDDFSQHMNPPED